jgi:tripartite-type tricarboxylate transporter receptor subunit TctC
MNDARSGRPCGRGQAAVARPERCARRRLLSGAVGAAALAGAPWVRAQGGPTPEVWPSRPVRVIQPFSAGSGPDVVTRQILKGMGERLNANFVVENKTGATGMIGTRELAAAAPDGHTIGYTNIAIPVAQEMLTKGSFDVGRDVAAIGGTSRSINVLAVAPDLPVKNVAELVKLLKANPGRYSYASGGNGTPAHLNGEIFKRLNGLFVVHVPYRGLAGAVNDISRNDIQFIFGTSSTMVPTIRAGRVRALAIAGPRRLPALPDVPTMAEAGFPNSDVQSWAGLIAPRGTPAAVIAKMGQALREVLAEPATVQFLESTGSEPFGVDADQFGRLLVSESERWRRFVRETGLKPD